MKFMHLYKAKISLAIVKTVNNYKDCIDYRSHSEVENLHKASLHCIIQTDGLMSFARRQHRDESTDTVNVHMLNTE